MKASRKTQKNTNLWRRYRLTHVIVAWQEYIGGKWRNHERKIKHTTFAEHYRQEPPKFPIL